MTPNAAALRVSSRAIFISMARGQSENLWIILIHAKAPKEKRKIYIADVTSDPSILLLFDAMPLTTPSFLQFSFPFQMASGVLDIPGNIDLEAKAAMLSQRRCILLAMLDATPASNGVVSTILHNGLLLDIKPWLDDILNNMVGGMDLLLHYINSITKLPVTKQMVTESKLGKAVATVEKHKIVINGKNQVAIKERISKFKEAWSASVRARKGDSPPAPAKRSSQGDSPLMQSSPKRAKTSPIAAGKKSSLSSLLKKVSAPPVTLPPNTSTSADKNEKAGDILDPKRIEDDLTKTDALDFQQSNNPNDELPSKQVSTERLKWADQSGGALEEVHHIDSNGAEITKPGEAIGTINATGTWSEKRKRDRMREKEELANARAQVKKSKLFDDGEDYNEGTISMTPTVQWLAPKPLPANPEVQHPVVQSMEVAAQASRMANTLPAQYVSDEDVPSNPIPLTDIEQVLELTSQSSSSAVSIPFSIPPPKPEPFAPVAPVATFDPSAYAPVAPGAATVEMVQQMGLPLFLVGSNIQALQTFAASPSLLQTFVDSNGLYDQARVMNLVQTLTTNLAPTSSTSLSSYQSIGTAPTYGGSRSSFGGSGGSGYRGTNNDSGNLHVSGYGPTTTEMDIKAFFAPYVTVDEVVMKSNFSFVNTSNADGAARAKEILNGALLGGMPIRVNNATRRARDSSFTPTVAPLVKDAHGQIQYDQIRDDRGNAPTRNLFVAGYGHGTNDQDLRTLFAPHCNVTAVLMKNGFSFVNTADKITAIHAREALTGTVVNNGPLRINFAKETGRLGTSFDSGSAGSYGPSKSHYGR